MGCDIAIASPKGYEVEEEAVNAAKEAAAVSGAKITLTENPQEAVRDADVIYSDVFTSMGQEEETQQRLNVFAPYQVNASLVSLAKPDYTFCIACPRIGKKRSRPRLSTARTLRYFSRRKTGFTRKSAPESSSLQTG